jgi:hypothetical protein
MNHQWSWNWTETILCCNLHKFSIHILPSISSVKLKNSTRRLGEYIVYQLSAFLRNLFDSSANSLITALYWSHAIWNINIYTLTYVALICSLTFNVERKHPHPSNIHKIEITQWNTFSSSIKGDLFLLSMCMWVFEI